MDSRTVPWNLNNRRLCYFSPRSNFQRSNHLEHHQTEPTTGAFKCYSNKPETYQCDYCKLEIDIKINLFSHLRVFHKAKEVFPSPRNIVKCFNYKCEKCDFQTYSILVLLKHKCSSDHLTKAAFSETFSDGERWFKCEQCLFKSQQKDTVKRHIAGKHSILKDQFKCEHCFFVFKSKGSLNRHIAVKHTNVNWFKCEQCPFKSKEKVVLKRHILCKHTESKDIEWFKCEFCSYRAKFYYNLKRHVSARHLNCKLVKSVI